MSELSPAPNDETLLDHHDSDRTFLHGLISMEACSTLAKEVNEAMYRRYGLVHLDSRKFAVMPNAVKDPVYSEANICDMPISKNGGNYYPFFVTGTPSDEPWSRQSVRVGSKPAKRENEFIPIYKKQDRYRYTDLKMLFGVAGGRVMLPIAGFQERAGGNCSHIQIGDEISDDSVFSTGIDDVSERVEIVEAVKTRLDYEERLHGYVFMRHTPDGYKQVQPHKVRRRNVVNVTHTAHNLDFEEERELFLAHNRQGRVLFNLGASEFNKKIDFVNEGLKTALRHELHDSTGDPDEVKSTVFIGEWNKEAGKVEYSSYMDAGVKYLDGYYDDKTVGGVDARLAAVRHGSRGDGVTTGFLIRGGTVLVPIIHSNSSGELFEFAGKENVSTDQSLKFQLALSMMLDASKGRFIAGVANQRGLCNDFEKAGYHYFKCREPLRYLKDVSVVEEEIDKIISSDRCDQQERLVAAIGNMNAGVEYSGETDVENKNIKNIVSGSARIEAGGESITVYVTARQGSVKYGSEAGVVSFVYDPSRPLGDTLPRGKDASELATLLESFTEVELPEGNKIISAIKKAIGR